jgi:hypothetical protein
MTEQDEKNRKISSKTLSIKVKDYVERLSEEQRMLVVLKSQLYGGSWSPMIEDLENRLTGKPYIFKLANRIQDDIERIEDMSDFESKNKIDLADYVELS